MATCRGGAVKVRIFRGYNFFAAWNLTHKPPHQRPNYRRRGRAAPVDVRNQNYNPKVERRPTVSSVLLSFSLYILV